MAARRPAPGNHATRKPGDKRSRKKTGNMRVSTVPYKQEHSQEGLSYEETVIKHILQQPAKTHSAPREALVFCSMLSSISPSMSELYYKSGEQVGRVLYKLNAAQSNYLIPEESIEGIIAFFERIGYKNVTYSMQNGKILSIEFHGDGTPSHDLGAKIHVFESGIISGYFTAAKGQLVNFTESSCASSDGGTCRFVETQIPEFSSCDNSSSLDRLADMVKRKSMIESKSGEIDSIYQSLVYLPMLDKAYSEYMKQIVSYIGSSVGSELFTSSHGRNGKGAAQSIEQAIKLLNLGIPSVKSVKPLDIKVSFDELSSRQGFVDMSVSFINGLLSSSFAGRAVATENVQNGQYTVSIKSA
jgi:predicted hydrocarbon binding protein